MLKLFVLRPVLSICFYLMWISAISAPVETMMCAPETFRTMLAPTTTDLGTLVAGTDIISNGDNTGSGNNWPDNSGNDVFHTFTTTEQLGISIKLTSSFGAASLYLIDAGGTVIDVGSNVTTIRVNSLPPGDYTVIVDANSAAAQGAFSLTIKSIKAQFIASPTVGCATPVTVFFTDTSVKPDIWAWNFGDGGTSSSQNPIHSYTASGEFTVVLTITDTIIGVTDTFIETINISVSDTDFTATGSFGCGPLSINFTDASAVAGPGTITNWAWTFGDGVTSSDQNPVHVYDKPGTYTVSLTTTNSLGCTKTRTKTNFIQVIGPDVEFTATHTGNDYTFTDATISGSPVIGRLWTFGDGATSTVLNPTHTYTAAGVYDVSLTVNDLDGCSRTLTKTNFVNTISGAFDVSQAIFTGDHERFSVGAALPRSLAFNQDGTKMFVLDASDDAINEYDLSPAYDVSTAVFAGDSERFSVAAQETSPRSVAFNTNGTKMFVMGFDGDDINEYDLATAFDISTASYAGNGERFSVAAQDTHPNSLTFNHDGTKMYVAGSDDDEINQYTLSAAFDVSTAVYQTTLSVSAQELFPQSIAFVDNGSKLLVMGSGGDDINEYNLTTAFDISTASYAGDAERLSVAGQDSQPNSFAFNASGTQLFVAGLVGQDINIYSLASPVIIGATANHAVNDNSSIDLFSTLTVQDPNGDNVSATITLDDNAKGILTGTGLSGTGPYTLASTDAASLQASLRALVFSPAENRTATSEITTFTLVVSDGGFSDTDDITTVISSAVAPTAVISSIATDPVNGAFTATFTFSEEVTGFSIGDISTGNGTTSDFTAISPLVYTALITPTTEGTVTIDLAAGVAQDAGGNDNTAAAQFSIGADLTVPMATITSAAAGLTNTAFTVTFTFSEEVTGFDIGDISAGNGTASDFTAISGLVYTALITPATEGTVTVDLAAGVAEDEAGNGNLAATQFSIEYDDGITQVICQNITVQLDANGVANIAASQIDNGSSDIYGIATMTLDVTTFDCNNIGDNNVTLTVTDVNGNTGTCVAVVTVQDVTPPTVIVRDITLPLDANGQASITVDDIDNGSSDNCGIASRQLDVSDFDKPNTTSVVVTLTVTDLSGNVATATATITFEKLPQTILFDPLSDKKVGADPVTLQATGGGSGLPVTFSIVTEPASGVASLVDGMIIIEGPGMVIVTANQAGNDVFEAATAVSRSFEIQANELFLPTLFSPNDDQLNDRFILRGGGNIATIELKIFDRDNNLVFSSSSLTDLLQTGWDGGEQPQGAYIWVVKGSYNDGAPVLINGKNTGFIRLAR